MIKNITILVILLCLIVACSPAVEEAEQPPAPSPVLSPALSDVGGGGEDIEDENEDVEEDIDVNEEDDETEEDEVDVDVNKEDDEVKVEAEETIPGETEEPGPSKPEISPDFAAVDKWSLWVDGPRLRGMDLHPCRLYVADDCIQPITDQDIQELRDLGANLINASYPGIFSEEAPYEIDPTALAYLDDLIGWAEEVGIYVVIHYRTGPGRNEGAILLEGDPLFDVWYDQEAHDAWVEMWRFTAERYRDNPVVAGYDLMVEPHPNTLIDPDYELEPAEAQAEMAGTLLDWNAFAAEMTTAIREVDPDTPIIVNSLSWASAEWFAALQPTGDPRTVYSLHAYDPDVYIIQEAGEAAIGYPDVVDDYGEMITFDRAWLEENYGPVREFAQQHNVPIYVGEFGALRWVPDVTTFLHDQVELFEQYGWNYAVYVWRGDEPDFDGFNLEYGLDPENHAPVPDNPLLDVFLDRWAQNVDFPGTLATEEAAQPEPPPTQTTAAGPEPAVVDKWSLWVDGPHLRGANIWQAIVIPELDGLEFKGDGAVGPPYSQEDFNHLAALGANYVSISGPGLFTETPPYTVDPGVEAYLDNLLAMIAEADMFATIGFRTGPGRSEFTLCCGGDPYFEGYFNDSVWEDQAAQNAWVEMWRYTAARYGPNPIVAGYKLMVEPNAAGIFFDIYDPDEFYADYAGTLYDWNQFYPRLVAGIREVDSNTPILVAGMGWSNVAWLPYLQPTNDPRTVYIVHQYEPQDQYTHQEPAGENSYPGVWDTDYDGEADQFDRAWLDNLLSTVDEFKSTHGVPVAVDEYGVNRWVPGGAEFMDDQMELSEQRGMNQALWEWQTSWAPFAEEVHDMDFRLGPDPDNRAEVANDLMNVITKYWARNTVRPSNFAEEGSAPLPPASAPLGQNVPLPPAGHIYHAVYPGEAIADSKPPPEDGIPFEEDGVTLDDLRSYEQHVGKTATWVYFSHNWFRERSFPLNTASWVRDAGSIPYIRLMLRSSSEQNVSEPTFTLDRIINGDFDDDLHAWARSARDFGSPLIVEYGTEVNGEWFAWNGSWNGAGALDGYGDPVEYDGPERFRDAYRHIIQIAREEGASNITWVFHVDAHDIPDEEWNRLELYYPGDEWIDWLGVSVYGALDPTDDEWLQFRDGMDAVYPRLAALSPDKPIALLEFGVASGNPLGDQAEWAEAALTDLVALRWPRLIGFSWWNEFWKNDDDPNHDTNIRVQDNPDLTAVFQRLVGNEPKVVGSVY